MAAKVINLHSPDCKNTYELTFTRDSVEATERAGFQIGQYTQMTNLLSNSRALFYGAFIARNKGINLLVEEGVVYKKRGVGMFVAQGAAKRLRVKRKEGFYDRFVASLVA